MIEMSREALFEAAWARPLTEIAEELGITSTGLKKICDRHDIPTPGRGYWAQVRAGRTFPRPRLRPPAPGLETVRIVGARPLPPAVAAAIAAARAAAPPPPRVRRKPTSSPEVSTSDVKSDREGRGAPAEADQAADVLPPALAPTARAIARARRDADGFGVTSGSGAGVVTLKVSPGAQGAALSFLATLLAAAEARGWRLQPAEAGARLLVEGEPIGFRLEELPDKTPHTPTDRELAAKRDRDQWGGDSQPWRTWDLIPSGRLALVIDENPYSGLRKTFSQRKGLSLAQSLDVILTGFVAHAAFRVEERRKVEARAKAAAIAEARRERLAAFEHRETRRAEFVARIAEGLAERARLQAVLDHLAASPEAEGHGLKGLEPWLRRRLLAIETRLAPKALEVSARSARVGFVEPPRGEEVSRWYAPRVELHLWRLNPEDDLFHSEDELDWAIAEGLVADPAAPPAPPARAGDEPDADKPH